MDKKIYVYAGTWTVQSDESGGGIGMYEYSKEDGSLRFISVAEPEFTAGMLCLNPSKNVLYAVDETASGAVFKGEGGGGRVAAFSVSPDTGMLTKLGEEQPTFGVLPVYVRTDPHGKYLIVCNHSDRNTVTKCVLGDDGEYHVVTKYSDVTAVMYPLEEDGSVGKAAQVITFPDNSSYVPPKVSCIHCAEFSPDKEHLILTDMKQDTLIMYRLDQKEKRLVECGRLNCEEGSYPHYISFHPDAPVFYLNYERAHRLDVIKYSVNGHMECLQTLDVTPRLLRDMTGQKVMQTDIGVSADGHFVYDLYRGANSILIFKADPVTGELKKTGEHIFGRKGNPRGFAISPDGNFLLTADNDNHEIITLRIGEDGTLKETGFTEGNLRYPACLVFYEAGDDLP